MTAQQFIDQGFPVTRVISYTELPLSTFYYPANGRKKGKKASRYTYTLTGKRVYNDTVVNQIDKLLQLEFVDYGYIKVTYWLREKYNYRINFKKVYRLMKENKFLLPVVIQRDRTGKTWIKEMVPKPDAPFQYMEFDIKYIYVHGARRNALLLSVIDIKSRWLMGWLLKWSIKKEDVNGIFQTLLDDFPLPQVVTVRSDNGSQFESHLVRTFLAKNDIVQEFTRPATPQQNGHIESYHSILERVICKNYTFASLQEAQDVFLRFVYFYNFQRIHSGIDYKNPYNYLCGLGIEMKIGNGKP